MIPEYFKFESEIGWFVAFSSMFILEEEEFSFMQHSIN